jgi:sirohydrochlorin ferrochelatase
MLSIVPPARRLSAIPQRTGRTTLWRRLAASTAMAVAAFAAPVASPLAAQSVGTIVVAHGGDSLWNATVRQSVAGAKTGGPLEVSFLMGPEAARTRFQDVVARMEQQGVSQIVVVPLLVSSYSGHYDQLRYLVGESVRLDDMMMHHLHMSGIEKPATKVPVRLAKALDNSPEVARILTDRAKALTNAPQERALFIVGHGPNSAEDYAAWMEHLRPVADSVKAWTGFKDVRVDMVRDDAPAPVRAEAVRRVRELIELQALATGKDVVVIPVLVSKGSVSRDKVPNDIRGTPSAYTGEPLAPHPALASWVERRVRELTASYTSR